MFCKIILGFIFGSLIYVLVLTFVWALIMSKKNNLLSFFVFWGRESSKMILIYWLMIGKLFIIGNKKERFLLILLSIPILYLFLPMIVFLAVGLPTQEYVDVMNSIFSAVE